MARITKTWEGLAKTVFTTADNFVVQIHRPLEEPLRTLVVASSLAVDTAPIAADAAGRGLKGPAIGEAVREARVRAIAGVL